MELNTVLFTALDKYFEALTNVGWVKHKEETYLFLFSYIVSIFNNSSLYPITNQDYKILLSVIDFLDKCSCFIDIPLACDIHYIEGEENNNNNNNNNNKIRVTESQQVRLINDGSVLIY